jgi:ADP-heptose:LPS heptosyltransferase
MTPPIRSVLVYSMGEVIGDGLIKLPFLAAVRRAYPEARLAWCAAKGETVYTTSLKPVAEGLIDQVIASGVTGAGLGDLLSLRRPFGGQRFDVILDTQTNVRRSLVCRRARAGLFVSPSADFKLSDRRPAVWPEALVDRLSCLLSLATGTEIPFSPVLLTNPRAVQAAEALLPGKGYVGFAPGAGGKVKRWPLDRYLALAEAQRQQGLKPVFFLGPDDQEEAAAVRQAMPDALTPELDRQDAYPDVKGPLLVIALAGRLEAAVANDAGPGHMLAAGGAPLLSLQQIGRKAVKFHPAARRLEMLVAEDYGAADMAGIPLADAEAALARLLSGP